MYRVPLSLAAFIGLTDASLAAPVRRVEPAAEIKAVPQTERFYEVEARAVVVLPSALKLPNRVMTGKVTFAPTLRGKPVGGATTACGHVHVTAKTFVAKYYGGVGEYDLVKGANALPVDPADLNKGCTYWLDELPAGVPLLVRAEFRPLTAWLPPCVGVPLPMITTALASRVTLPEAPNVRATVDFTIDFQRCGF